MIIPIHCMNCGNPIADLWRNYQKRLVELREKTNMTSIPDSVKNDILKELNLSKQCCRKHIGIPYVVTRRNVPLG